MTNEKRAAHNVTPHYVAEAIGSSRSGAWHFTWQTVFFIGQMTLVFVRSLYAMGSGSGVLFVGIAVMKNELFDYAPFPRLP